MISLSVLDLWALLSKVILVAAHIYLVICFILGLAILSCESVFCARVLLKRKCVSLTVRLLPRVIEIRIEGCSTQS